MNTYKNNSYNSSNFRLTQPSHSDILIIKFRKQEIYVMLSLLSNAAVIIIVSIISILVIVNSVYYGCAAKGKFD